MFASCDSKLGSALVAVGAVTPRRLLGQHICNTRRRAPLLSDSDCARQDPALQEEQGKRPVNKAPTAVTQGMKEQYIPTGSGKASEKRMENQHLPGRLRRP